MERVVEILQNLGLKKKECNVFLCSLRLGQQPASVIARTLKLNRVTAYVILKDLFKRAYTFIHKEREFNFFRSFAARTG